MTASAPAKKGFRYLPAIMSLDMRGRLVADKRYVFAYGPIQAEIGAAKTLGKALAAVRAKKLADKRTTKSAS